jgi:NADPH2:quinone reductase
MPKIIRLHQYGNPSVLRVENVDLEPPQSGEVQVLQTAIGLNFVDTYFRSGLYPLSLPSGLGMEAAGSVVSVGAGTEGFAEGDRVAYVWGPMGAYAELRNVPATHLVKLPPFIPPEVAAAILLKGLTAEFLLFRLRCFHCLQPGLPNVTLLVTAAAGGVGSLLCSWARAYGLRVLGVVGSEAKKRKAMEAGCEEVWLQDEDFSKEAKRATRGKGVDAVFDGVGKASFRESLASLKLKGLMISYGNASGPVEPVSLLELASMGSLFLTRPRLADYVSTRNELEIGAAHVFEAVARGYIQTRCEQSWPLSEAAKAHEALESRQTQGLSILYAGEHR